MAILINLNNARKKLNELEGSAEYNKGVTDAFNVLFDLPTVEVEPTKHGRWKAWDLTWGRSIYVCTSCGDAMEVPTENGKPIFNYCPNCGARMDEPEAEP